MITVHQSVISIDYYFKSRVYYILLFT